MWCSPRFGPRAYPVFTLYCTTGWHSTVPRNAILLLRWLHSVIYIFFNDVELTNTVGKIEGCLSDLDKWMSLNKLKLNKARRNFFIYTRHNPQQSLPPIRFGQDIIQPSQFARNIGVIFDSTMTMLPHISSICRSASYHLRNISQIRKFLSTKTTKILVHALVSSKLNHCNSLLYNVPEVCFKKSPFCSECRCPDLSPVPESMTTSLQYWKNCTSFLFLNALNSRLCYLPLRLFINNLLSTFKIWYYQPSRILRSSHLFLLNPTNFHLKLCGSQAFAILHSWTLEQSTCFYPLMWQFKFF